MTDIITYCEINTCEDCPRYGDDCDGDKRVEHTDLISRGLYEAQDIIEALPSADAVQGEWIPCSEMLPDVGENVLFTTDIYGGYVAEGDRRADGKWWQYRWNSLLQNDEVLAWMPLPKPYREDGEA